MKTFHRVIDPGHSWLKVPVEELERLGIADQITSHSYLLNGVAYLEEDVDMPLFMNARGDQNTRIVEFNRQRNSRIRKYDAYTYQAPAVDTDAEDEVPELVPEIDVAEDTAQA
jgi:hypothetical protein